MCVVWNTEIVLAPPLPPSVYRTQTKSMVMTTGNDSDVGEP